MNIGTPVTEPSAQTDAPGANTPASTPVAEPGAQANAPGVDAPVTGASMEVNTEFTVQALLQTVAAMQESIAKLTRQLNETRRFEIAGAPKMDLKDQKDPSTFSG